MAPRSEGTPLVVTEQGVKVLDQINFNEKEIDEGWLQKLMFEQPQILPINNLDPGYGPLVPIGREIGTAAGPIDNLYVSPSGLLTVVEAKLWRNPQARREVVGQIIDYAKELNRWSFEDLDAATLKACGRKLWDLVSDSSEPVLDEARFVDAVSRNLKAGRFMLLIVGDGIREEMERMADFLQDTPQLRFSLALIELQVYRLPEPEQLLVTPVIVSRTKEISRAIVRVEGGKVDVTLDIADGSSKSGSKSSSRRTLTHEEFFQGLKESGATEAAIKLAHQIHDEFDTDDRFLIDWKAASYSLKLRDPVESNALYTILVVETAGTAYVGWLGSQLERAGLSNEPAKVFAESTGRLVGRRLGNGIDFWDKSVTLDKMATVYGDFKTQILELADTVYSLRQQEGTQP